MSYIVYSPREPKMSVAQYIGGTLLVAAWFLTMVLLFSVL